MPKRKKTVIDHKTSELEDYAQPTTILDHNLRSAANDNHALPPIPPSRRVVDLFAGAGGMSLGLQQAGYEVVAAFENWRPAIKTHEANFRHTVHQLDLSDEQRAIELIRPYEPHIISGGPPCQDFSGAGQQEEGRRAGLTVSFSEIVGWRSAILFHHGERG